MTTPIYDVVDDVLDAIRKNEQTTITMSWKDFYKLNDISRFKEDRKEQLIQRGLQKGIIWGFGDDAVIVCRDRNFAPVDWDD